MLKCMVVSVVYNPTSDLAKNLSVDYFPHLVVDNSIEETKWLKDLCYNQGHQYYWQGENTGIAAALNCGAGIALEHGCTHIVTMDQDSCLNDGILAQLTDFAKKVSYSKSCAIISPLHSVSGLPDYNQGNIVKDDPMISMTSGNLLNLAIWQQLGGFDERLFIDGVDFDYYLRAHLAGYKVLTLCDVLMPHNLGSKCRVYKVLDHNIEVLNHSAIRKYYIARNYLYLYQTYKRKYPPVRMVIKILLKMIVAIVCFEQNKLSKLRLFALGIIDYFRGKFGKLN